MSLTIIEVTNRKLLKEFIDFPSSLYADDPCWLPPISIDERKFYNPAKNRALTYSDTILLLAKKDGRTVGRVMGIINHKYNELKDCKVGRFFRFECIRDKEVAHALLSTVENWARSKGMERMIGPFGFSDKDPQGLLMSGYEQRAILLAPYNPPYYLDFILSEGYDKEIDLVEYLIPVPDEIPDFYKRIHERILQNQHIRPIEFTTKRELKPFVRPVLSLMNETFSDVYGSYSLTEEEMDKFAAEYLPVLNPALVKVVKYDDELASFFIAMPDIGPGLQKARGKLLPFGFIHILKEMKRTDYLVLLLGGIKSKYQGMGLDVLMGIKMLESASKRGYKVINSHLELETNVKVRAEMEKMGGKICKNYRIFQKKL